MRARSSTLPQVSHENDEAARDVMNRLRERGDDLSCEAADQIERLERLAFVARISPVLAELSEEGFNRPSNVAAELNRRGVPIETGHGVPFNKKWTMQTVMGLRRRLFGIRRMGGALFSPRIERALDADAE
jgi:hypothetical protein